MSTPHDVPTDPALSPSENPAGEPDEEQQMPGVDPDWPQTPQGS